jgi:transcriptional regulator with XRE-family HTH domain
MDQGSLDPGSNPPGIGPVLRTALRDRGLNGKDLAGIVDVSENTVSNWMTGKHSPSRSHSERIAGALDMSIDEIYGRAPLSSRWQSAQSAAGDESDVTHREAQRLLRQLVELGTARAALQEISAAVPPLLDVLADAQKLAERWSSGDN